MEIACLDLFVEWVGGDHDQKQELLVEPQVALVVDDARLVEAERLQTQGEPALPELGVAVGVVPVVAAEVPPNRIPDGHVAPVQSQ